MCSAKYKNVFRYSLKCHILCAPDRGIWGEGGLHGFNPYVQNNSPDPEPNCMLQATIKSVMKDEARPFFVKPAVSFYVKKNKGKLQQGEISSRLECGHPVNLVE